MLAICCVQVGFVLVTAGGASLLRPLRMLRIKTRRRAAAVLAAGAALTGAGLSLPAPLQQVPVRHTKLDEFVPAYQFAERHEIRVAAAPERVYAAVKAVRADEIVLFQTLVWLRRFGRQGPESILNPSPDRPILDVATQTTFVVLADVPARELLVGTVVKAPRSVRFDLTPAFFKTLEAPGFAKAAMNFLMEPAPGGTRLVTETRVVATDPAATRAFARYWRVIYPGSAFIRRMWLRAVKRRAEAPEHT